MYKYFRIFLYSIPIIILVYLLNKQFPLNGKLIMIQDFKGSHPFIGKLTPVGKVHETQKTDGMYYQTITGDPIYFDVELPSDYQTAKIELKYKSINQPIIKLGGLVNKESMDFKLQNIQNENLSSDWQSNSIDLDLTTLYKDEKNKIRFMISVPDIAQNKGKVSINQIKIDLQQRPLLQRILEIIN